MDGPPPEPAGLHGENAVQPADGLFRIRAKRAFLGHADIGEVLVVGKGPGKGIVKKPLGNKGVDIEADFGCTPVYGFHDGACPGGMAVTMRGDEERDARM